MLVEIGSSLACARTVLKELHYQSSLLATLRERVSEGVELANRYYQTWHSIFWNGANAATKRRVTAILDRIAGKSPTSSTTRWPCSTAFATSKNDWVRQ